MAFLMLMAVIIFAIPVAAIGGCTVAVTIPAIGIGVARNVDVVDTEVQRIELIVDSQRIQCLDMAAGCIGCTCHEECDVYNTVDEERV